MSAQKIKGPGAGPPPFLAAAAVLFWGGLTRHWIIAVIVALALEACRVVRWRADITEELFTRIWNLCTVLFATVIIIAIVRGGLVDAVYIFVTWLPVVLLPIVLAQRFAAEPGVPTSAFSFIARRRRRSAKQRGAPVPPPRRVDLAYPYTCLVLVAGCAANVRIPVFYAGAVVLLGWALWMNASRPSLNPVSWGLALLVVGGLGFAGHIGLQTPESERIL